MSCAMWITTCMSLVLHIQPLDPGLSPPAHIEFQEALPAGAAGWNWDAHKCVSVTPCAGFVYTPTSDGVDMFGCKRHPPATTCSGNCKYCTGAAGIAGWMCQPADYEICTFGTGIQTCGLIQPYKCVFAVVPPAGQEATSSNCYCASPSAVSSDPCSIGRCE